MLTNIGIDIGIGMALRFFLYLYHDSKLTNFLVQITGGG